MAAWRDERKEQHAGPVIELAALIALCLTSARRYLALIVFLVGGFVSAGCDDTSLSKRLDVLKARAEQGDAQAQFNLGFAYHDGQGVPRDDAEAVKWIRLAAAKGLAAAQLNLGTRYQRGEGVPRDYMEAYMWISLATAQGEADAGKNLDLTETLLTPEQRVEAQKMAREWKPQSPR
jgi:TPR repeat protein